MNGRGWFLRELSISRHKERVNPSQIPPAPISSVNTGRSGLTMAIPMMPINIASQTTMNAPLAERNWDNLKRELTAASSGIDFLICHTNFDKYYSSLT